MPLLSVIIPAYNEAGTIRQILEKIQAVPIQKEIIVVDDGSTDATVAIVRCLQGPNLKIIHHTSNRGKGSAVATGLVHATGDYCIIQDADLEYDPNDYLKLLTVVQAGEADVALGARFTRGYRGLLVHRLGNRFLTGLINILFGARLNDCFSCYKLLRRETLQALALTSQGFDIEAEIIVKATRRHLRVKEIPVYYRPRQFCEGKKIRIKDGLWVAFEIIRMRIKGV
jgi:glycosyltransferase involved in cell wall biosynthesis